MNPSVAIVVTCMGRTTHLRQSLPLMLQQNYDNFIIVVVDWSSPDDLEAYLSTIPDERVHAAVVPNKEYFSLSGARNAGGDYLCRNNISVDMLAFIDADVLLPVDFLKNNLAEQPSATSCFYQRNKTVAGDLGIWGSCICPFRAWQDIRYNEEIDTYGEEDNEFYSMLIAKGYIRRVLKTEGIVILEHSDEMRMEFYREDVEDIPRLKKEHKKLFRAPSWQ